MTNWLQRRSAQMLCCSARYAYIINGALMKANGGWTGLWVVGVLPASCVSPSCCHDLLVAHAFRPLLCRLIGISQVQVSGWSEWPPLQLAMNLHSHSAEGNYRYYTNFHAVLRPIYSTFTTVGPIPYNMHSLGAIACQPSLVSR